MTNKYILKERTENIMKTICLINMKGGVGKTTVAVNLADFLVKRENKRVLLIDVDPQFNATQCIMNGGDYIDYIRKGEQTITDIFDSAAKTIVSSVEGAKTIAPLKIGEIQAVKSNRGFDFIPGDLQLFKVRMEAGSGNEHRLKSYLALQKDNYDYVIIDSPPTPSVWMTSALIASDFYLIPVKPDPISMTGVDLLSGIINEKTENYGLTCKCCGIILTMVDIRSNLYKDAETFFKSSEKWKNHIIEGKYLMDRKEVAKRQLKNGYIIDIEDTTLKTNFSSIVKEIIRRVG